MLALGAAGSEEVCERRAEARLTAGETFADVNGARLRYRAAGLEHSGPVVVLLPGMAGSLEQMRFVERRLGRAARTLSYDRAGYGFSSGSHAHTAAEQAAELVALLDALALRGPVVLVGYSTSALVARVFGGSYPERTAGLYLVEPDHPEFDAVATGRPSPRRDYARWVAHDLATTTFGIKRLATSLTAENAAQARANEVLLRRRHYVALAREWYVLPETYAQARAAKVPPVPFVVLFTEQSSAQFPLLERSLSVLVARSPHGRVTKLPHHPHDELFLPGPVLDAIVDGVLAMVKGR